MPCSADDLYETLELHTGAKPTQQFAAAFTAVIDALADFEKNCESWIASTSEHAKITRELRKVLNVLLDDFHIASDLCSERVQLVLNTLTRMDTWRSKGILNASTAAKFWQSLERALDASTHVSRFAKCQDVVSHVQKSIQKCHDGATAIADRVECERRQSTYWWKGFAVGFGAGAVSTCGVAVAEGVLGPAGSIVLGSVTITGVLPVLAACTAVGVVVGLAVLLGRHLWNKYKDSTNDKLLSSLRDLIEKLAAMDECAAQVASRAKWSQGKTELFAAFFVSVGGTDPDVAEATAAGDAEDLRQLLTKLKVELDKNQSLALRSLSTQAEPASSVCAAAAGFAAGAAVASAGGATAPGIAIAGVVGAAVSTAVHVGSK